jgi:hypothetical protein
MTSAPEKVWVEEVWVPIGTEAQLQDLARAMGSTRRPNRLLTSPTGRLMAIERKVDLPGKSRTHFWLQVVLNPWTWADQQPVIDLLNVDLSAPEGFTIVDTDEGRCRWEASNSPWPGGAPVRRGTGAAASHRRRPPKEARRGRVARAARGGTAGRRGRTAQASAGPFRA